FPFLDAAIGQAPISAEAATQEKIELSANRESPLHGHRGLVGLNRSRIDRRQTEIGADPDQAGFVRDQCSTIAWLALVPIPGSIERVILVPAELAVPSIKPNSTESVFANGP